MHRETITRSAYTPSTINNYTYLNRYHEINEFLYKWYLHRGRRQVAQLWQRDRAKLDTFTINVQQIVRPFGWLGGVVVRMLDLQSCDFWLRVQFSAMTLPGYFWDKWPYFSGKLSWDITTTQVNLALHPFWVVKSSTSFGWGKGGKVTTAREHITLCDPTGHVVISISNCYIQFTLFFTYFIFQLQLCTFWLDLGKRIKSWSKMAKQGLILETVDWKHEMYKQWRIHTPFWRRRLWYIDKSTILPTNRGKLV